MTFCDVHGRTPSEAECPLRLLQLDLVYPKSEQPKFRYLTQNC